VLLLLLLLLLVFFSVHHDAGALRAQGRGNAG
jgi:hypothetical protein